MMDLSFDSLSKFLIQNGYSPTVQQETSQLLIILKADKREYPLFLRILGDKRLLQGIAFLPPKVSRKTLPEVARLLHLFNKEIDLPGFGIDEISLVTFYRFVIPSMEKKIDPETLLYYLNEAKSACSSFSTSVETIASGAKTVDQLLRAAEERTKE